ncbi:tetratricopeptide repeat protein [Fusibacter bizertensis]
MQNTFNEIMARLLKRFVNDVVFIELKPGHQLAVEGVDFPENITLPVFIDELAKGIKSNEVEEIPVLGLIKGLVYIIGSEAKIEHYNFYLSLLSAIDDQIENASSKLTMSILMDGLRYAEDKQFANAILYFNAVLKLDPNNVDAYYNMGRSFEDLSNEDERSELKKLAKYCFEKCLAIEPNFSYAHFNLGFLYYNEENYQLAEMHWLNSLKIGLTDEMKEEVVVGLGRVKDKAAYEKGYELILAGRVDEGLEILKALEEDHDEWWNLLFFIGVGYRMLEQYEDALAYFLKVMSLNTGHIQTMNELGICLLSLGDYDEAEKYFKEAIRLSPQNAEIICNLGIVYYNRGDESTARSYFQTASELAPEDEVVQMWKDHINKKLM